MLSPWLGQQGISLENNKKRGGGGCELHLTSLQGFFLAGLDRLPQPYLPVGTLVYSGDCHTIWLGHVLPRPPLLFQQQFSYPFGDLSLFLILGLWMQISLKIFGSFQNCCPWVIIYVSIEM